MKIDFNIRCAQLGDVGQLLLLMQALAKFENYLNDFKVTESELVQRCFRNQDFQVLVAEVVNEQTSTNLVGMVVYYLQPFTYDLAPWLVIKELFVSESGRGSGVGSELMKEVARRCVAIGGSRVRWEVLSSNVAAQRFYNSLGAHEDTQWQTWHLSRTDLINLV